MNIQKSRLMAMFTVMLMVCMMVTTMIIPASAAEVEDTFVKYSVLTKEIIAASLEGNNVPLKAATYEDMAAEIMQEKGFADDKMNPIFVGQNTGVVVTAINIGQWTTDTYGDVVLFKVPFDFWDENHGDYRSYYLVGDFDISGYAPVGSGDITATIDIPDPPSGISAVVTKEMLSGVLDEVVALLPVVIPVMIGFIGLRKGISFLQSVLHSA